MSNSIQKPRVNEYDCFENDFSYYNFSGSIFKNACFTGCDLSGVDLRHAELDGVLLPHDMEFRRVAEGGYRISSKKQTNKGDY